MSPGFDSVGDVGGCRKRLEEVSYKMGINLGLGKMKNKLVKKT